MKLILLIFLLLPSFSIFSRSIVVGSKNFNESYLLGEIFAQVLEEQGFEVTRKFGLGGTMVLLEALRQKEIDVYPEYTGTLEKNLLHWKEKADYKTLKKYLRENTDLRILSPLGFENAYALSVRKEFADTHALSRISDLNRFSKLKVGLSYEYLEREDGWKPLSKAYGLHFIPKGMEHSLLYEAIRSERIDLIDVYTTDGEIPKYDLVLLQDDLGFYPSYLAVPFTRVEIYPMISETLDALANQISKAEMQRMNWEVTHNKRKFRDVASEFLHRKGFISHRLKSKSRFKGHLLSWEEMIVRIWEHLRMTGIALLASFLFALPFSVLLTRSKSLARIVLYLAGLMQTIPSIALLAFMIPIFGIGTTPAIAALFLYSLLPILRNTYSALLSIDPELSEVARALGLSKLERLRCIEIPLAMPNLLSGLRTATVISIGTATLAAFIGAGGLGQPIVTGIALNDPYLILQGAIPAAILALLSELGFETLEKLLLPPHLRPRIQ